MKDFYDYVAKNKFVILFVTIVVILYAIGIVDFLTRAVILLALIAGAVFLGKKVQDNEERIKDFIKRKGFKQEVYYYRDNEDKK